MDIEKLKQKYAENRGKDNFTELLGSVSDNPLEIHGMYESLLVFIQKEIWSRPINLSDQFTEEDLKEFREKFRKIMGIK